MLLTGERCNNYYTTCLRYNFCAVSVRSLHLFEISLSFYKLKATIILYTIDTLEVAWN